MIRTGIFLVCFLSVLITPLRAQNWDFYGGINYGTYSMKDMKGVMRSINVPEIPLEHIEDFPATVGIQGGATCLMPKVSVGFFFASSASDSRLRYADNSGSLIFDASCGTLLLGFDVQPFLVKKKEMGDVSQLSRRTVVQFSDV